VTRAAKQRSWGAPVCANSETATPYAAKFTGMLLEMGVTDTLNLMESKIDLALTVLKVSSSFYCAQLQFYTL